jgi:Tfp pilus assembly protein FimT
MTGGPLTTVHRICRLVQDARGYSVMELLVSVIILQAVFLLVFAGYSSGVIVLGNTSREWEGQESARFSLQLLARNLRQATHVAVADANQVGFYADLDNDGIAEGVLYRLVAASGRIERGANRMDANTDGRADGMPATFDVFLRSVVNPTGTFLSYYDANGTQITGGAGWLGLIRAIGFEVVVDISTTDRQPPVRYQTVVQLRNVGFRSY